MWQAVDSSMMKAVLFHPTTEQLDVEFNTGKCFRYDNVSQSVFNTIMTAPSVGKEFHKLVRSQPGQHPFQSITKE